MGNKIDLIKEKAQIMNLFKKYIDDKFKSVEKAHTIWNKVEYSVKDRSKSEVHREKKVEKQEVKQSRPEVIDKEDKQKVEVK